MSLSDPMSSASASRLDRLLSWIALRGKWARRSERAAMSGVHLGQKWKVCSQGEWLDVTVSRFEDGLVILRFEDPDQAGSREGVTLTHFMLTAPDRYRLSDAA